MPDIDTIRVVLPTPEVVRISVTEAPTVSIVTFRDLPSAGFVQKQTDYPTPETENEIVACLQAAGLCALIFLSFLLPANASTFGDIPRSLALPAGQTVRRNAGNTGFEAFTPSSYSFIDSILNTGGSISLVNDSNTPGNSKYYGTDSGGVKGFFSLPVSGVSSWNGRTGDVLPLQDDYAESQLSFTDILTNNVSTSAHGFQPKLPDDPTLFLNGQGDYVQVLGGGNTGSRIIAGGGVACSLPDCSTLDIIVSAADYIINGATYHSNETTLTLANADPTFPRLDTVALTDSSTAVVITGTAATNPVAPAVDPVTQLFDTTVLVPAGGSGPSITTEQIYLEDTEWTMSKTGAPINLASTNNPYAGTKCIEATASVSGNNFTGQKPSGSISLAAYTNLVFQVRSKASWPNPKSIAIFWMLNGVNVGNGATLKQGSFGFDTSNTTTYQQIVIPASAFNTGSSSVNQLRFQVTGGGSSIGFYVDNILLQSGSGGGAGGGDVSSNTSFSVLNEFALFADNTGKLIKRANDMGTGAVISTAGVMSTQVQGNISDVGTDGIVITGGTAAVLGSGVTVAQHVADTTHNGYLSSTDWNTFNGKSTVTPAALTKTDDTNVTLTLGGTPATALLQATSLTLGWTGTLATGRGGTGVSSLGNITKSDDTNVTLTLGGTPNGAVITSTSFTLGWTGTLGISRGGFGKAMTDPNADRLVAWDDTDGDFQYVTVGTGLTYTHSTHTLAASATAQTHAVTFVMDGFGSVLTARTGSYIKIPYGGTLTGWTLIASPASSSITVDIIRATDTNGLPSASIVGGGGTKPSISSGVENKSTSFTGWTSTTLNDFDNLAITTSGITTATYVALTLYYQ